MSDTTRDGLADRFEENRPRLRALAYRTLGSATEADDAVQETWLRLDRAGAGEVDNLPAWLTTVCGRICLDMLRSRATRREQPLSEINDPPSAVESVLADEVEAALLIVLGTLAPAERLAFVLHDLFAVSFDEIAVVVGRTPQTSRQLASRARRRVRAAAPAATEPRGRAVVDAFLSASRGGDLGALLELLDPDVVLRATGEAARLDAQGEKRGAEVVARYFAGKAQAAVPALVDGAWGFAVFIGGELRVAVAMEIKNGQILGLAAASSPAALAGPTVTPL
ncbi:sigma-70 family RNA polymerase sigma factor [Actinoplanes sp. NBRC 101535]|uniref:sigma-70 family RNA polymerase sigma factor n=1 Tax=Actinoplanes sp. NBRC 101535 TaxID=3032196 RepID=UPI0024A16EC5|nr:sigma-70 family RNA polymerase sigma factor [Actinoplanes sp. NBRC 101535]GLY00401.1 RNA polymerase sigma factor [Actinoplanes sp. NBRC 101535]